MKKFICFIMLIMILLSGCLGIMTSCNDAETIKYNLSNSADHFDVYRKVTVINLRSDSILLEAEGLIAIKDSSEKELAIIIQTGKYEYKMHYFYFGGEVIYLVEQIDSVHTDAYHWDIRIHAVIPNFSSDYIN